MLFSRFPALTLGFVLLVSASAHASFHIVQIEQIVDGVNGDSSVQAIQLRMRSTFQNFISGGKLIAYNANGLNPVTVIDFATNVSSSGAGVHILIVSPNFACRLDAPPSPPISS